MDVSSSKGKLILGHSAECIDVPPIKDNTDARTHPAIQVEPLEISLIVLLRMSPFPVLRGAGWHTLQRLQSLYKLLEGSQA